MIVGIENSDGNTNVRFHQKETLRRIFERLESKRIVVNRFRADCGSCSEDIVNEVEKHCKTFYIRANRCCSLYDDMFALKGRVFKISIKKKTQKSTDFSDVKLLNICT